jgi:hypothetical protein
MSYQINNSCDQMNDIYSRDQFNDCQVDNAPYSLFNAQGFTPTGDEIDMNINNSFSNLNADLDHPNNNMDNFNSENFIDNEFSAPPVLIRKHISEEENSMNINNILIVDNNDNKRDINEANNFLQNEEFQENEEKDLNPPLVNKEFHNFNQNYLDSERDTHNYFIIEDNYKNHKENNNEMNEQKNNEINNIEMITPNPDINEENNPENKIDIQNNNLSNSSSSQNTNLASNLSSSNYPAARHNSIIISSQTFEPNKNKDSNENSSVSINDISKTENNINDTSGKLTKTITQRKKYLRRNKPDSLRKKIKSRMHKNLKEVINKRLRECGSIMFFDYFPQPFITNVNVVQNKAYLKLTMRTLFKMIFGNKTKDKEKVKTNLKVLNYLDSNDEIRIKSGIDKFLNSTYKDIIQEYMNGNIFKKDLEKLHLEGESEEYINKYRFIGKNWIEFYHNNGKIKNVS